MRLEAGDVFVVPQGDPYKMASDPGLRDGLSGDAVLEFFRHMATQSGPLEVTEGGGGPQRAHIVCGFLGCDIRPFNPVLEALPRALHLRHQEGSGSGERLSQLVDLALAESRDFQWGSRCVLLHLSELLFVEAMRAYASGRLGAHHRRGASA